jgi:predicted enzyme related to lactoylglutathione lyase
MAAVKAKARSRAKPRTKSSPAKKTSARPSAAKKKPPKKKVAKPRAAAPAMPAPVLPHLRGLRSCIYQVDDLAVAKEFYAAALGKDPYFDEPYYVGFEIDGQELGLDPDVSRRRPGGGGTVGYWRVDDINAAWQHLTALGAQSIELPHAVGVDLQTSIVADPFGNYIGLIQGG